MTYDRDETLHVHCPRPVEPGRLLECGQPLLKKLFLQIALGFFFEILLDLRKTLVPEFASPNDNTVILVSVLIEPVSTRIT